MENSLPELAQALAPAQNRHGTLTAAAEVESNRAVAEIQGMMLISKRFPRNEIQARDKILNACMRKGLAEKSQYSFSRGGTDITGPSIRLAEVMVAAWGNIVPGWREISRMNGVAELEAYAWDLETNTRWAMLFQQRLFRNTKTGGYPLTDERDIYELCANQAARRVRACILKLIPGDIVDDAVAQCNETLRRNIEITPALLASTVEKFAQYGVTKEMLEARIQRRLDSIQPAQVIALGRIYTSLQDGMSKPEDWFDVTAGKADIATPAAATDEVVKQKATRSRKAPATPQEAQVDAQAEAIRVTPPHDPETGELTQNTPESAQKQAAVQQKVEAELQTPAAKPQFNFGE